MISVPLASPGQAPSFTHDCIDRIRAAVKTVTRATRHRLRACEAYDDFEQDAWVYYLEREASILDRLDSARVPEPYLRRIVDRFLIAWRRSRYGRWRVSRRVRALGACAVEFDRMVGRDGLSPSEAMDTLLCRTVTSARKDVEKILASVRPRPRRRMVTLDALATVAATDSADVLVRFNESLRHAASVRQILTEMKSEPSTAQELRMLTLFHDGVPIGDLASTAAMSPSQMYGRLFRCRRRLRRRLEEAGIGAPEAQAVLDMRVLDSSTRHRVDLGFG